jgi:hypothetical protein
MKVQHFYRNTKRFLHEYPFYRYYFETPGLNSEIIDFLLPGETVPRVHIQTPIEVAHTLEERKENVLRFAPDILHCHHVSLLEDCLALSSDTGIPLAYTIYRHGCIKHGLDIVLPPNIRNRLQGLFVPHQEIMDTLGEEQRPKETAILAEVVGSQYTFKPTVIAAKTEKTFAALISEKNEPYVQNIHRSLEKILVTNHTLNIAWVCLDESVAKSIRADLAGRKVGEYVRIVPLNDFPMLQYDGMVTDGNLNHSLSDSQYFHLLFSCLAQGKLLITYPEEGMEDILLDGTTCFIVSKSTTKLSHLIHFLINFPDEMENIVNKAKEFCGSYFSAQVMQDRLIQSYQSMQQGAS